MTQHYEKTETRRRQIADAALDVLAEDGLGKLTTRSIAARVGITDGTIFRHFDSKKEIVLAAMERLELMMFGTFPGQDLAPMQRLERFFRSRAQLIGRRRSPARLVFSQQLMHAAGDTGRAMIQGWKRRNLDFVHTCLVEIEDDGALPEGFSAAELVPVVQGVLLTYALDLPAGEDEAALSARIDQSWTTLHRLLTP